MYDPTARLAAVSKQAAFLVTSSYVLSGFGFVFWAVATRITDPISLGFAATTISLASSVSSFSLLGCEFGIIRFLPTARNPRKLETQVLLLFPVVAIAGSCLIALILGGLYIVPLDRYFAFLILISSLSATSTVLDAIFTAVRDNRYGVLRALGFSVAKLVLLPLFAVYGGIGVVLAYSIGLVAGIGVVLPALRRISAVENPTSNLEPTFRSILAFSGLNFAFVIGFTSVDRVAPLLILVSLGPAFASYYYVSSLISQVLFYIPESFSRAVFAEGALSEHRFGRLFRRALARTLVVLVPVVLAAPFLSGTFLMILGGAPYKAHGLLLTLFLVSVLPSGIIIFFRAYFNALQLPRKVFELGVIFGIANLVSFSLLLATAKNLDLLGLSWVFAGTVTATYGYAQYRRHPPPAAAREGAEDVHRSRWWYTKAEVAATYDARRFGHPIGRLVDRLEKKALRRTLAELPDSGETLEIACGTGRMTSVLVSLGHITVASDVSKAMIDQARVVIEPDGHLRSFVLCDAARLPFRDGAFENLMGFRFIAHLPPSLRAQVLSEAARVSRKNVILSAQTPWSLKFLYRYLVRFGDPIDPPYALSPRQLGREAQRQNLQLMSVRHILRIVAETYVAKLERR